MTGEGLYCPAGDFYLDPWRPVPRAIITHGHSDHARAGHGAYLTHPETAAILRHRLGWGADAWDTTTTIGGAAAYKASAAFRKGEPFAKRVGAHSPERPVVQTLGYGKTLTINGVRVTFYPAGHIPGSAQVLVEHRGDRWVFSGDYYCTGSEGALQPEMGGRFCAPFASVPCRVFITESTFGLPVYRWPDPVGEFAALQRWWAQNQSEGRCSVLIGYSLGKAQRLLHGLDASQGPIYGHGAVRTMTDVIRGLGYSLPELLPVDDGDWGKGRGGERVREREKKFATALVIAPPGAIDSPWMKRLEPYSLAFASGWMRMRGPRRRHAADRGFVLSDHADWDGLNAAVHASGAERVLVTHGFAEPFSRRLREQGLDAAPLHTLFEGESGEIREGREGREFGEGREGQEGQETRERPDAPQPLPLQP
ncbi:MAG: MBL fold metallo-hydrolase [Bacteroidetes bacterium]|nr:MBL fold metallo-hydrolase [Bacteroidota bacterium]